MPNSGSGPKRSIFDEEDHGNVPHQKNEAQQDGKILESHNKSQQQKQG